MNLDATEVKVLGELRPGATYALRVTELPAGDAAEKFGAELGQLLAKATEQYGCKFLVLGPGLELLDPKEYKCPCCNYPYCGHDHPVEAEAEPAKSSKVRVWAIGEEGELYAAHNEVEMRAYYKGVAGTDEYETGVAALFRELTDQELDAPARLQGELPTTMRREAELSQLPAQIWGHA